MRTRFLSVTAALVLLAGCGGEDAPAKPPPTRAAVEIGTSPVLGLADAWVTIVEFSDFQCPYCAAEAPVLQQVLRAHPGDVRLVYKHLTLPRHADARGAAIAAECAGDQDLFWEMHDELFAHQDALGAAQLPALAQAAGVPDMVAWQACLASPEPAARVDADVAVAAQLGIPGTPTLIVNGDTYFGAYPYDQLKILVEDALGTAQQSGIPRAEYYDRAVLGR